jgi:hypothetical protein
VSFDFILLTLALLLSGPARAVHESVSHDAACGTNAWAYKRFSQSLATIGWWNWLDNRVSSNNKYLWAVGRPAWVGQLLQGPLVGVTDLWHFSYTVSNVAGNVALGLALLAGPVHWWTALLLPFVEDILFEPTYKLLRNYK